MTQTAARRLKTVIIARTNGVLMKMAHDMKKRCPGIKMKFIGRDIAKVLKDTVIEILEWRRNVGIEEFRTLMEGWIGEAREQYKDKEGKEALWAKAEDAYDQLCFILTPEIKDSRGVLDEIDRTFVDADSLDDMDASVLVFASGHRSKGLEWERAIVVRPDLMPHPNAEGEEELEQEEHIKIVSFTRGKEALWVCYDKKPDPRPDSL